METESIFFIGVLSFLSAVVVPSLPIPEVRSPFCILSTSAAIRSLDKETKPLREEAI
jgi:hypothetical protein